MYSTLENLRQVLLNKWPKFHMTRLMDLRVGNLLNCFIGDNGKKKPLIKLSLIKGPSSYYPH